MKIHVAIDLENLIYRLSDKEVCNFILETVRDRVPDESHVSLITEMFNKIYDSDKKEALVALLKNMGDEAKFVIEAYLTSIPSEYIQDYENMIKYIK